MKAEIRSKVYIARLVPLFFALILFSSHCCIAQVPAGDRAVETMTVNGQDLEPVFSAKIMEENPLQGARITIQDFRTYPARIAVPKGALETSLELLPNHNMLGRVSGIFTLRVDGQYVRQMRAIALVEAYLPVVCATAPLAKGHVISQADLSLVEFPVSKLSNSIVLNVNKAVGMSLKYFVRQGQPLSEAILTLPKLVKKGSVVTIVAQSATISVSAPGEARQDGAKNEFIKVKNLMSQREIVAKVLNENTVMAVF